MAVLVFIVLIIVLIQFPSIKGDIVYTNLGPIISDIIVLDGRVLRLYVYSPVLAMPPE